MLNTFFKFLCYIGKSKINGFPFFILFVGTSLLCVSFINQNLWTMLYIIIEYIITIN